MRRTLVTGGSGFIGSCLVRQLLETGCPVVANLDMLTYASAVQPVPAIKDGRYVHVRGDIRNASDVAEVLQKFQPEVIFHLAAETHVDRSIDQPTPFFGTNTGGTFSLLEQVLRFWETLSEKLRESFRFVQVSTDEVFGSIDAGNATETSPYLPSSPYAASKAAADHFVRAYFRTYEFPSVIVHPTNNYGPGQFPEKLLPLVIAKTLAGEPIPLYGNGSNVRTWTYVEDTCAALRLIALSGIPGESYIVSSERGLSNHEIITSICEAIEQQTADLPVYPLASLITAVADRPGHDQRYASSSLKLKSLGWTAKSDLQRAISETVRWYLENREWLKEVAVRLYDGERLGLGSKY